MSELVARPYRPDEAERWDEFVVRSPQGTVLHTRRFLGYHGSRFEDQSWVVERDGRWVAVFGAARDPRSSQCLASHPGATFGGPLFDRVGDTKLAFDVLGCIAVRAKREGYSELSFRVPPAHLSTQPDEALLHALCRRGARVERMDLWSVLTLDRACVDRKARRDAKRAIRLGVSVAREDEVPAYVAYHALLADTLRQRHDVRPVHDVEALIDLRRRLGDEQSLWIARHRGEMAAGAWVLQHRPGVFHTQYLASSPAARECGALDALVATLVEELRAAGARCLSFGASTENAGRTLNAGLHHFKSKHGGGALIQHHARWELSASDLRAVVR